MRDRHGRGLRRPMLPPSLPAHRTRQDSFDDAVAAATADIERRWSKLMTSVEVCVELVPPSDPAPWEDGVPVSRVFPADAGQPARVVLYRKPLERRSEWEWLPDLIRDVLVDNVAHLWGRRPEDVDPRYGRGAG